VLKLDVKHEAGNENVTKSWVDKMICWSSQFQVSSVQECARFYSGLLWFTLVYSGLEQEHAEVARGNRERDNRSEDTLRYSGTKIRDILFLNRGPYAPGV
jgi:hypothetical protein